MKRLKERWTLLCVILFSAFTTCIYAPFDMYLSNRNEFWFGVRHFWWIPVAAGAAAMIAAGIIGCLLRGGALKLYTGLLFAFGLCSYIQGNFLSLKVGVLDGKAIQWDAYKARMWLNAALWLLILAGCIVLLFSRLKRIEKAYALASLLLTAMQLVSLIILLIPSVTEEISEKDKLYQCTDKDIFSLSPEKNVLVFLVDMCDDTYFRQALSEKPEMTDGLDGFVYYSNHVGGYEFTHLAVPLLLTGQRFLNQEPRREWLNNVCEDKVYWDYLLEEGYDIGVYTDQELIPERLKKESSNCLNVDSRINYYRNFTMDLYRFVMCRYFPDIVKPSVWMSGTEFNRWKELDSEYQSWYYDTNITWSKKFSEPALELSKENRQFKFIHTLGSHAPYDLQEDGSWIPGENTDSITATKGSFALLLKYLNAMKELGIYDSSSIVIMADHGYNAEMYRNPVFMVKEPGARGKMKENDAPVSQWEFASTMLALAGLEDSIPDEWPKPAMEIQPGETRERLHYFSGSIATDKNDVLTEYTVDSDSNSPEAYHPTGYQYDADGNRVKNE